MTYEVIHQGDTAARNLAAKPKFLDTEPGPWKFTSWPSPKGMLRTVAPDIADKAWVDSATLGTSKRLGSTDPATKAGAFLYVPVDGYDGSTPLYYWANVGTTAPSYVHLLPVIYGRVHAVGDVTTGVLIPHVEGSPVGKTIEGTIPAPTWETFDENDGYGTTTYRRDQVDSWVWGIGHNDTSWSPGTVAVAGVRLDHGGSPVTGYLDGDTADTADYSYSWDTGTYPSTTTATALTGAPVTEPDPEPGTDPGTVTPEPAPADTVEPMKDTAVKVLGFLGIPATAQSLALAEQHVRVVTTFVRNYCHDNGFKRGGVLYPTPLAADLEDVIISATARYVLNPQQAARQQIGGQTITYASLEGFTLAEKAVLNRYRRRTA